MRWQSRRRSSNIEDRRGRRLGSRGFKGGIGTIIIALVASYFLGIDPSTLLNSGLLSGGGSQSQMVSPPPAAQDKLANLVSSVLAGTEDAWGKIFSQAGRTYQPPKLVLFSGVVQSACGTAQAATGPFYCPGDRQIYIDLDFYHELKNRLGAPGDFAQAYVIAHEVGHHVQNLLGINDKVRHAMAANKKLKNALSVRQELQADCFAGIWANYADKQNWLERGDLEEALNAASQIGDDALQKKSRGYVVPDSFTHGSSRQRMEWFNRGFRSGKIQDCNTFGNQET